MELSNDALLGAVRPLAQVRDPDSKRWRSVDYRNLDAEELGSIYESLLELVPKHSAAERTFELVELAGNDRKTTGSYYTPSSLIETLLDSSLDPVINEAIKRGSVAASAAGQPDESEAVVAELLKLNVCDPACGSGHFLVAAARRIAKKVAAVQEGNPEPTVETVRSAMHQVVAHCIYGVDLNPMAVELAKVSLWMEALEPGRPLNFLDAHIKHGNALIGATPRLLRDGIPDEAFKPIEGDDKKYARFLARTNKEERGGQIGLFDIDDEVVKVDNTAHARRLEQITGITAEDLDQVRRQEAAYREWAGSDEYVRDKRVADAWCAAFMWRKTEDAPRAVTQEVFRNLSHAKEEYGAPFTTVEEIGALSEQYRFFHWHLEFPDVFSSAGDVKTEENTGWSGGFDCVVGNPPWERIKLQEQEFFAQRDTEIAQAPNAAARKRLIKALKEDSERQALYTEFEEAKRKAEGESQLLRLGGRYPLTGRGDINTYAVFSELDRTLTGPRGRMGVIVPTGIATDATTQHFFKDLVQNGSIAALYDFENRSGLFPAVDSRMKFCILSLAGRELREPEASFAFFLHDPAELGDADKAFTMTPEEITLLNPNTGTCPVFRSRRDAEITLDIYRRVPVLVKEGDPEGNPWGVSFMRMFDMSNDSHLFHTREQLEEDGWSLEGNVFVRGDKRMLPLYEAKMIDFYNHRSADVVKSETAAKRKNQPRSLTLSELGDSVRLAVPYSWVSEKEVIERLPDENDAGFLGWRDITSPSNERTVIVGWIPKVAAGNSLPISVFDSSLSVRCGEFIACLSSYVLDYVARIKVGSSSKFLYL